MHTDLGYVQYDQTMSYFVQKSAADGQYTLIMIPRNRTRLTKPELHSIKKEFVGILEMAGCVLLASTPLPLVPSLLFCPLSPTLVPRLPHVFLLFLSPPHHSSSPPFSRPEMHSVKKEFVGILEMAGCVVGRICTSICKRPSSLCLSLLSQFSPTLARGPSRAGVYPLI